MVAGWKVEQQPDLQQELEVVEVAVVSVLEALSVLEQLEVVGVF